MKTLKAGVLAGLFLATAVGPSGAQLQYCNVPGFNAVDTGLAVGYMTVKAGRVCGVARLGGDGDAITDTKIITQPRSGRLSLTSVAVRYTPTPGYVGADSFAFEVSGRDRFGRPTARQVQMHVKVTP
jgi:hypothetical protein